MSVIGTVFMVNAEAQGSRVAVIEGEVHVQQGASEKKLRSGEQVATNPSMPEYPVSEEIAWSRNAEEHLARLQQAETPEKFEVISIRPRPRPSQSAGGRGGGDAEGPAGNPCLVDPAAAAAGPFRSVLQIDPARFSVTRTTLHALIAAAYGVSCHLPDAISGEPEWGKSDPYDVDAAIPAGSPVYTREDLLNGNAPRLQKMLQNLLADRFRLTVRREMKEMPAYNLVVAKAAKWDCDAPPTCHGLRLSENQAPDAISGGGPANIVPTTFTPHVTISSWTDMVTAIVERPVIDKTGLNGYYDIRFELADLPGRLRAERGASPSPEGPLLIRRLVKELFFPAVQEQLGFRFEPTRSQVEVIVVDHVDRPTEN